MQVSNANQRFADDLAELQQSNKYVELWTMDGWWSWK